MHTKEKEKEAQGTIYSNADLRKLILPLIMEQLLAIFGRHAGYCYDFRRGRGGGVGCFVGG